MDAGPGAGPLTSTCTRTKTGAWGVVTETASTSVPTTMQEQRATARMVHATAKGDVVAGDPELFASIAKSTAFDFDGDGEEELVVEGTAGCAVDADLQCMNPLPVALVFTFAGGKVARYRSPTTTGLAPAHLDVDPPQAEKKPGTIHEADRTMIYRAVKDADGDGRPDFETYAFYETTGADGDVTTYFVHGPTFLAHSLPNGDFSLTDAVATKALAESCAAATPFAKATPADLMTTAVCARLAGETTAAISARYAARCAPLLAPVQAFWKAMEHGKSTSGNVDFMAAGTCRTEPEGGWSFDRGIPRSLVKLLDATTPLLAAGKGSAAKP